FGVAATPPEKSTSIESADCRPCNKPETEEKNAPPNVTAFTLDRDHVRFLCPLPRGEPNRTVSGREMTIELETKFEDKENDIVTYNYKVSGGRIVGTGARVYWNLDGLAAGTYEVAAGVDDGCGICGTTMKKSVTVSEAAPNCASCRCPRISISGPDTVSASTESEFSVVIADGNQKATSYNWTVENGIVTEGQGTPNIRAVMPSDEKEKRSSVAVQILGFDENCGCITRAAKRLVTGK
ncbi:MAG: hypothetical protein LC734_08945, partial [Acidobacteria bacterium]|nr:hypothetical protein [Acidobacteriota bacterium]